MTIVFQKSMLKSKAAKRIVADAKLTYFKEKVLEHLDKLERKEKKRERLVQKALVEAECLRKAAYPVGTIREWKGKKYIKTAPGKWRRKYDSDSRGAKQSIAAIKRKVDKCESVEELLEVAKQNKHRFTDADGKYLPFVKEMFDYVGKKHKEIKAAKNAGQSAGKGKPKAGGSGGGDDGDGGDKAAKVFGHNYKEFKGKGKAAIEKLLETKNGYVEAAYHKEGIGDIDVVYGKVLNAEHHKGFGLAHILDKHPDITPETIDKIIRNGKVETRKQKEKGFNIRLGNHVVGINKGYQRRGKVYTTDNWIVTSYEEKYPTGNFHQADVGSFTGGTISPPNPSDNSNVSQTGRAVKQKTLNATQIMQAGKNGERVRYEDIDWDALEKDKGKARQAITKENMFGNVDWDALKAGGMKGGAGFLISRIYDCIEDEPMRDSPEARQGYVRGINELRDTLESAKTAQDVQNALEKIKKEIRGDTSDINIKGAAEYKERKAKADALEKEWKEAYQKAQELEARREYEKAEKARKKEYRLRDAANAAERELDDWEREQKTAEKKQRRDKWWYLGVDFHALFDDNARLRKEIGKQLSQAAKGNWNSWSWLKDSKTAGKKGASNDEEEPPDIPMF